MTVRTDSRLLDITAQAMGQHVVLVVNGELDAYSSDQLRDSLVEQSAAGKHTLVIDLSAVPFIDSSGLGVLVGAFKRARAHSGRVCLLNPADRMVKMLKITGLGKVFPTFDDLQAALDHLDELSAS